MWRQITESQMMWAIIAVMIGIDALWARSIGIRIADGGVVVLLLCVSSGIFVYATFRAAATADDHRAELYRRIAVFAETNAQFAAFAASAAVLSYLAATSKFPLVDRYLAAADAALGFDWLALFTWVQEHPAVNLVLAISYGSFMPQIGILLLVLTVIGQLERMREFFWLFVLTLLIATALSWLFPAESAWVYFGVTDRADAYHLADFRALRAAQIPEISISRINGLITFPSFHASMALILIYGARGIRVLFTLSLVLNVLMIASTPTAGGHYLVDIVAGLAVVPLAIFIQRLRQRQREPSERLVVALPTSADSAGAI